MRIDDKEIWCPIQGYSDKYEVSNLGNVRSLDREIDVARRGKYFKYSKKGKLLRSSNDGLGYRQVVLYDDKVRTKTFKIHRLVANAFINNDLRKETVNHKDGNKANNKLSNLEWATRSENSKHKYIIGLDSNAGERHPNSKLTENQVLEIRNRYANGEIDRIKLGHEYGISPSHVFSIAKKKSWRSI